jgi:hypothetical protein
MQTKWGQIKPYGTSQGCVFVDYFLCQQSRWHVSPEIWFRSDHVSRWIVPGTLDLNA